MTVQEWIDAYGRAWEERDAEAAANLFTSNAVYRDHPLGSPHLGQDGVRSYWSSVTATQDGVRVRFGTPVVAADDAVALLDSGENPGFEYEGEVAPDAALNPTVMKNYPFSRLTAPANVLIMPGLQSANISAKLLRELAGSPTIGPMLIGMEKPVQIIPMTAIAPDVLTLAVLAAAGVVG